MSEINEESMWKNRGIPCGKCHNNKATKTTVSLYLTRETVEKARKNKLNLSRITEQALLSILDYLEAQNQTESSKFISSGSFLKESEVPRAGFEPATTRSSAGCSPRLSYLGNASKSCCIMSLSFSRQQTKKMFLTRLNCRLSAL